MSRPVIGAVVAILIAALTAVAYFITSSTLEERTKRDLKVRVEKAQELLVQNSSLEMLGLLKRTEALSRDPDLVKALVGGSGPNSQYAETAYQRFRAQLASGEARPDVMAVTDDSGRLVALVSGDRPVTSPIPDTYLKGDTIKYPALARALSDRNLITSEVWDYENLGPMKVGVAPIWDEETETVVGAVLLAYAMSATEAKQQQRLLGTNVAYFYGDRVTASSFGPGADGQGNANAGALSKALADKGMGKEVLEGETGLSDLHAVSIGGEEYWVTAGRLPRFSTQPFPDDYPGSRAGAMVMLSLDDALAPLSTVRMAFLLVGIGAIIIALLGMYITARRILGPLDEIETGVNDIINGNLERTFRPVGSDLDGLANALNVLLARLLGRPEPGEEEYDDEGNVIRPGALAIDTDGLSEKDAEAAKLAAEPEQSYMQRLFEEYCAARQATGEGTEGVTFESFTGKLRQNESVLRAKYQCRAVRFKVVTKDNRVTLKPVPIV